MTSFAKRHLGFLAPLLHTGVVVVASLLLTLGLLAASGHNLLSCIAAFWEGTFGSLRGLGFTLTSSCPLVLTGLAVAVAFRCGVLNIGAEGQLLVGTLFATAFAVTTHVDSHLLLPALLLFGCLGGGLWAAVAGALRLWRNVPEVLSTILLNFVAIEMVKFAVTGPLEGVQGTAQTAEVPAIGRLWILDRSTDLHAGIFIAVLVAVVVHLIVHRTTVGFELRAVGSNPTAALYAGMPVTRNRLLAICLSGCLAGVAGTIELVGRVGSLSQGFTTVGYGYTAIAVAMLARLSPLGVIASALFFGALAAGSREMTFAPNHVPDQIVEVVRGLVVLFAIGYGIVDVRYRKG